MLSILYLRHIVNTVKKKLFLLNILNLNKHIIILCLHICLVHYEFINNQVKQILHIFFSTRYS